MIDKFEIQQNVKQILQELDTMANSGQFVYQPKVEQLMTQLDIYQQNCEHEFENGICKYCRMKEGGL